MLELLHTLHQSLWVWLATDVLLWSLFVLFLLSLAVILRSPLQRAMWQRVFRQRLAVVSAVLLVIPPVSDRFVVPVAHDVCHQVALTILKHMAEVSNGV